MKVSVIIVNYNTPDLVINCLSSLEKNFQVPFEVIIVDNGCEKRMDSEKLSEFPNVRYFFLESNRGFGAGNNFGASKSTGDILWLLNSDTLVPDRSINQAIDFLEKNSSIGILSPLLFNDRDLKVFQTDMYASFQTLKSLIARKIRPLLDSKKEFFETDLVVGASMLIRQELFQKLGGFDEKIFMFFEDDDLCYRVRQQGYSVGIYNRAKIIHLQGRSIQKNSSRKRMYYQSQDYFWSKHYGFLPTLLMKIIRWPVKIKNTL